MNQRDIPRPTIAIFDSGVGGLTVTRAVVEALPAANIRYLGDTARLPYGTKSAATVVKYALQAASALLQEPADALIVACNTASSCALPALQRRWDLPVIGVVEPGARRAVAATHTGRIGVIVAPGKGVSEDKLLEFADQLDLSRIAALVDSGAPSAMATSCADENC